MNIYINPLSDKGAPVLQPKPSGSPISQLRFKRGSSVPLTVTLPGVEEASNLRIGMKRRASRWWTSARTVTWARSSGRGTPGLGRRSSTASTAWKW